MTAPVALLMVTHAKSKSYKKFSDLIPGMHSYGQRILSPRHSQKCLDSYRSYMKLYRDLFSVGPRSDYVIQRALS